MNDITMQDSPVSMPKRDIFPFAKQKLTYNLRSADTINNWHASGRGNVTRTKLDKGVPATHITYHEEKKGIWKKRWVNGQPRLAASPDPDPFTVPHRESCSTRCQQLKGVAD